MSLFTRYSCSFVLALLLPMFNAVNGFSGDYLWRYEIASASFCSPAIGADGSIYIGPRDNKIVVLDADGHLSSEIAGTFSASRQSPMINAAGTLFVVDETGDRFISVETNGTVNWTYNIGSASRGYPAMATDGTLYIGADDYYLHAVNPDGSLKWKYNVGHFVAGSVAVGSDGTIYVGSYDNKLYAISSSGDLKWSYTTGNDVRYSPAIDASGNIYFGSMDGVFYALSPTGDKLWSYEVDDSYFPSNPAIGADGTIYVGSGTGTWGTNAFYAFNANGTVKWSYPDPDNDDMFTASPAITAEGVVYAGTDAGRLYAFDADTGDVLDTYSLGASILSDITIGDNDTVIVVAGGYVYGIAGTSSLATSSWPRGRQNARNTAAIGQGQDSINITPVITLLLLD